MGVQFSLQSILGAACDVLRATVFSQISWASTNVAERAVPPAFLAPNCLHLEGPSRYVQGSCTVHKTQLKHDLPGEAIPDSIATTKITAPPTLPHYVAFCLGLCRSTSIYNNYLSLLFQNIGLPTASPQPECILDE